MIQIKQEPDKLPPHGLEEIYKQIKREIKQIQMLLEMYEAKVNKNLVHVYCGLLTVAKTKRQKR